MFDPERIVSVMYRTPFQKDILILKISRDTDRCAVSHEPVCVIVQSSLMFVLCGLFFVFSNIRIVYEQVCDKQDRCDKEVQQCSDGCC